jgi:hypothetical protein
MKKLFFMPVAILLLLSGCDKQREIVKPVKANTTGNNLRGINCPGTTGADVPLTVSGAETMSSLAYCPYETCTGTENYISSVQKTLFYNDNGTGQISSSDQIKLTEDAHALAIANKPTSSSCSGGSIITKYFYSLHYAQITGRPDGLNLTISYWCCTAGGGGID